MTSVKWTDVIDSDKARRERIATAAMQGLINSAGPSVMHANDTQLGEAAALAVRYADALIAELDKERP